MTLGSTELLRIDPSAVPMLQPWSEKLIEKLVREVYLSFDQFNVEVERVTVQGYVHPEEDYSALSVIVRVDASRDEEGFAFWGYLARWLQARVPKQEDGTLLNVTVQWL